MEMVITLEYQGRRAEAIDNTDAFPGGLDTLEFFWEEGNGACDCNRSRYFDEDLPCGEAIALVSIEPKR